MTKLTRCAVPGIGHRIKSRNNPDLRVELVKDYVLKHFPSHKLLDYAIAVETVTTSKKDNLILNVGSYFIPYAPRHSANSVKMDALLSASSTSCGARASSVQRRPRTT